MGASTLGPSGRLVICLNMITALSSAVWTPAQTKNTVWEGPAGICRTHKEGLQELEGQPKPPRLGSTQCLPLPGMWLQSLLKIELVCLVVFLCVLICVNRAFLICVNRAFLC